MKPSWIRLNLSPKVYWAETGQPGQLSVSGSWVLLPRHWEEATGRLRLLESLQSSDYLGQGTWDHSPCPLVSVHRAQSSCSIACLMDRTNPLFCMEFFRALLCKNWPCGGLLEDVFSMVTGEGRWEKPPHRSLMWPHLPLLSSHQV
jgi:hypothetical protein